jgi:outer membrane protein OmpA-like peptidoglycan-associated protein
MHEQTHYAPHLMTTTATATSSRRIRLSGPIPMFPQCLILIGILLIPAAQAQRETFDATTQRSAPAIAKELSLPAAQAPQTITREGSDAAGAKIRIVATEIATSFGNVNFVFDSTELRDRASADQLTQIGEALRQPELKDRSFLIEGHTCDKGSPEHNLGLSARRAEAIRRTLVKQGLRPEQLAIIGMGMSDPTAPLRPNDTDEGLERARSANRRVVIRLLPIKK